MRRPPAWAGWGLGLVFLVVAALVVGQPGGRGRALDPDSHAPAGARGVVETMAELGVGVVVQAGPPGPDMGTALVLVDRFDGPAREALMSWVNSGGRLVLADPSSPMAHEVVGGGAGIGPAAELAPGCAVAAFRGVGRVVAHPGFFLAVPEGSVGCFRAPSPATGPAPTGGVGAHVVVTAVGAGTVVVVGGPEVFLNRSLGEADNAALVAALLVPSASGRSLAVVRPPGPGEGEQSLVDLVPVRVKLAVGQLGVAFVVVALWRARRLGRPVQEDVPTDVTGSQLPAAVGELMQRARAREQAASVLRDALRGHLSSRLGLPAATPAAVLAGAVASRTGREAEGVLRVLEGPVPDEGSLVRLAQEIDRVRQDVAHG